VWTHSGTGSMFANANGGWEYPLYLSLLAVVQAMRGDGACALMPSALMGSPVRAIAAA